MEGKARAVPLRIKLINISFCLRNENTKSSEKIRRDYAIMKKDLSFKCWKRRKLAYYLYDSYFQ